MPVQIGGPPEHGFSSPLQLLSDCHRRIEHFLNVLYRVAGQAGDPLNPEEAQALTVSLRYFREAAPRHTQDEEESLFPRLEQSGSAEVRQFLGQLAALEAEHARADTLHAEVERIGKEWLASGSVTVSDRLVFQTRISELQALYAAHIQLEDTVIFPLAARVLNRDEQFTIGGEMAARRSG